MDFDEVQFFDTCDDLDPKSTEDLMMIFKDSFVEFGSDMYEYICNLETKDVVLLFMIVRRFLDEV